MASVTPELKSFHRIVVKVGSSLLVNSAQGELYSDWLNALAEDLAERAKAGAQIVVVSSGAIALGRTVLKFAKGALKLEESQAAAAVGQIALARAWSEALGKVGLVAGQVLKSAAIISMPARPSASSSTSGPFPSSTRTTPSRLPKSATATMTASPRVWRA